MQLPKSNNLKEIEAKKKSYQAAFSTESGKRVLADLEKLCFIHRSTFSPVRDKTLLNEGMRYVVVHIKNMMNMDIKRLTELVEDDNE